MKRRLFDLLCATVGLLVAAPILAVAALGIWLASPGPVLYRATRVGRGGRPFTMFKLRTMNTDQRGGRSRITAADDSRVFLLGRFLRATKIDELPQLVNVLRGEMAIVGPRPEDPDIVREHYRPVHWATLSVRPGLSSPGSLYHETHCVGLLKGGAPEAVYTDRILPLKLALDLVYVRRASLEYDVRIVWRTIRVIAGRLVGSSWAPDPPELLEASREVVPTPSRPIPWPEAPLDRRQRPRHPVPAMLRPNLRRAPG